MAEERMEMGMEGMASRGTSSSNNTNSHTEDRTRGTIGSGMDVDEGDLRGRRGSRERRRVRGVPDLVRWDGLRISIILISHNRIPINLNNNTANSRINNCNTDNSNTPTINNKPRSHLPLPPNPHK